jgi:galactokinase
LSKQHCGALLRQANVGVWQSVSAHGRVNLIGEHTDYNGGLCLPMALPQRLTIRFQPRLDGCVCLTHEDGRVVVREGDGPIGSDLAARVQATMAALHERELPVVGFEGQLSSNVPQGAGLSSSAALGVAVCKALAASARVTLSPQTIARVCQRAESMVGVRCGIMDPLVIALAEANEAFLLDCSDLAARKVACALRVAVLDTGTRRELHASAYNDRRRQCEEAARALDVDLLCHAGPDVLDRLSPVLMRRARHVLSENRRVSAFAECLETGESDEAGRLLVESHVSLRQDFDVVTAALDAMAQAAMESPAVLGARMTGAGFGGCVVALLRPGTTFEHRAVLSAYHRSTGLEGRAIVTGSAQTHAVPG